jgi:hypothetical protein
VAVALRFPWAFFLCRWKYCHLGDLSDAELDTLHQEFQKLRDHAAARLGDIEASKKKRQRR